MFPSLVNCCTIDWFDEWPEEALLSVSESFLLSHQVVEESLVPKYSRLCVTVHQSVAHMAHRFFEEMRRHYYVTPTSYLEFIALCECSCLVLFPGRILYFFLSLVWGD